MYRQFLLIMIACLPGSALADPIHARADGAYWHHDSGWIFPEKIGEFVRVGIPQDVAGSEDAVAHYASVENGERYIASVDVYRAASASATELEARPSKPFSDEMFLLSSTRALPAIRQVYDGEAPMLGVYFIDAGDWRVRIRIAAPKLESMDAFVRGQHWETLGDH